MNKIWMVISVILISLAVGELYSLASHPEITLRTVLDDYSASNGNYGNGQAITGQTMTKPDDGWSLWDIPLLGPVLSILIGFGTLAYNLAMTFLTGLNALLILPTFLPGPLQTVLNWIEIGIVSILLIAWMHGDGN